MKTKSLTLIAGLAMTVASQAAITTTGGFYGSPSSTDTWVGFGSNSTLLINGDSDYATDAFSVGYSAEVSGTATVTGIGSTLTTNRTVVIGYQGIGALNILNGGVVTSNGIPTSYGITLGSASGSSGSVLVDGSGSQWYIPSLNMGLGVNTGSSGSLTVRNGGNVTFGTGSLNVYNGTLLVTGAGSTLNTLSSLQFNIGDGTATISAGGVFNSAGNNGGSNVIGSFLDQTGSMLVTGAGSQWNVVGNLYVGARGGTGTLTVADGGVVSVSTSGTANADGTGFASIAGDGILSLGYQAQSSNPGAQPSTGTLSIGAGGAAGRLNVAEVYGYYATGTPAYPAAVATLVFNHNETGYAFTNAADEGILISGTTKVVNEAGTTVLTAASTYFGGTEITGGKLIVNNTTGSGTGTGAVTVGADGTLGGYGTIGGLTTISTGGHLAPGTSPGTLTFANGLALEDGAILDLELGTLSDLIRITGGTLSGVLDGEITLNLIDSGGFAAGTYTLIDFTGADIANLSAASFRFGSIIGGYAYEISLEGNQFLLTAAAVPEPSTGLLAGLAAAVLLLFRRRRPRWR